MSLIYEQCKWSNTQGASGSLNAMKFKETKKIYLMQKITITLLVLTTTAGLQMDALSTVSLVLKSMRSLRSAHCTESFHFEDDI